LKKYVLESEDNDIEVDEVVDILMSNLSMFKDIEFSNKEETKDYVIITVNSENPLKARTELASFKFSHATGFIVEPMRRTIKDGFQLEVYDEDGDPFDRDVFIRVRKGGQYNAGVKNELNFSSLLQKVDNKSIKFVDKNGKELVLNNVESIRDCSKDPGSRMGNRADVEIITDGKPFRISLKKDSAYKVAGLIKRFSKESYKIGKLVRKYFLDNNRPFTKPFKDHTYITIPITNPELYRWCVFGNDMQKNGAVIQGNFSDDIVNQLDKPVIKVDQIITPDEDDATLMEEFPVCVLLAINKRGAVEVRAAVIGDFAKRYFNDELTIPGVNESNNGSLILNKKLAIFNGYHIYTDMDENNIFHTCYKIKDYGVKGTMYVVVVSQTETEIQYQDLKWNEERCAYGPETRGGICTIQIENVEYGTWRKRQGGLGMEEIK
jgi:hypothetical protein